MTDGLFYDDKLKTGERTGTDSSVPDDRWVFTEDNPSRELTTAAHLAAVARVLKGFNDDLEQASALMLQRQSIPMIIRFQDRVVNAKIHAAIELFLTTGENNTGII